MHFKRAPLVATLLLVPILLSLGFWQLNRAEEKRAAIRMQSERQASGILALKASSSDDVQAFLYKPVQALGQYDNRHQFLLDNQIYKGRAGYYVLTPFVLKGDNKAVLVNRGWVPLGQNRAELPDIRIDSDEITVTGRINHFPSIGIKLAGAEIPSKGWPAVVQVVDSQVLAQLLGYPLFDFQVELDPNAAYGYLREWHQPQTMTPEKHTAYAVQWFLLALTLTVLFVKYGIKKAS